MFMHKSKKGFTIVELVIVIAVIAILAAVLIPTFSNLVKKANIASDTSLAKNINTALTAYEATNGKVDEFSDVIAAAKEAGYIISNLNPTTEGCYFVWESSTNQILLVDSTDGYKVIYANNEKYATAGNTWYFAVRTQAEANTIKAAAGMADVNAKLAISKTSTLNTEINSITNGDTIYIDGGIEVDAQNTIKINNASAKVTIDLGSSAVVGNVTDASLEAIPFEVTAGELNLKGGVISATGTRVDADGYEAESVLRAEGGTVSVDGTKVNAPQATYAMAGYGDSAVNIKNVDIVGRSVAVGSYGDSTVVVEDSNITCEFKLFFSSNNESQSGKGGEILVKSGNYTVTAGNMFCAHGGTITIEGGTFTNTDASSVEKMFSLYNVAGSKIVVKGGTFAGIEFSKLTKTDIEKLSRVQGQSYKPEIELVNGAWEITLP